MYLFGDANANLARKHVYVRFDVLSPWSVGQIKDQRNACCIFVPPLSKYDIVIILFVVLVFFVVFNFILINLIFN